MSRTQRLSFALLLLAPACSDDVSGTDDTDSTGTMGTTTDSGETPGTTLTTTINPATTNDPDSSSSTTLDPDSSSSSTGDDPTDPDSSSSSTGEDPTDSSSSTGEDPTDSSSSTGGSLMCGNALVDGEEDCDGDQLAGETCESQGFVSGDLACTKACVFDISGCETCGNDVVDAGDVCDGADLNGADCTTLAMGFTGGTLGCSDACEYDTSGCTSDAMPGEGEVIVSEIQKNPDATVADDGEWFELHNPSDTDSFQLTGCIIEGTDDESFTIVGDLQIGPGEYLTFADESEADLGFLPDVNFTGYNLVNSNEDRVALVCAKTLVDEVVFGDDLGFPDTTGASLNLDPLSFDAVANDVADNWCDASSTYSTDFGTPGAANDDCPIPVVYAIDSCYLQDPLSITADEGSNVTVYGRVSIAGLTDVADTNTTAPEVDGYLGYGPDGSDPSVDDTGWIWTPASSNDGYDNMSPGFDMDADEYFVDLTLPDAGDYDYAFRFSGDDNETFSYCDATPDVDGYASADAGQLTSEVVTVDFALLISEYAENGGLKALEIFNPADAAVDVTGCELLIYSNLNVTPTSTITLDGEMAAEDVMVLCSNSVSADETECDVNSGSVNFTGNDAIVLRCGSTILDTMGNISATDDLDWGPDTGFQRDCDTLADTDATDAWDVSINWTAIPLVDDDPDFTDFGQYICD